MGTNISNGAVLLAAAAALLATGCGEEAPRKDPTLRGLVARLRAAGVEVSEKRELSVNADQKARVQAAAGLANQLTGAGIKGRHALETQRRKINGHDVTLERFLEPRDAEAEFKDRARLEAARSDAGMIVHFQAGGYILTVRGTGSAPGNAATMVALSQPRPTEPPAQAVLDALDAVLADE